MTVLLIALMALALYGAQKLLYRKLWDRGLRVAITFDDTEANEGDTCTLTEVVENRKWLPLSFLKVKFETDRALRFYGEGEEKNSAVSDLYYRSDTFSLLPYRRIRRRLPFVCTGRGIYSLKDVSMVGADLFLQTQYVKNQINGSQLAVYPKRVPLPPLDVILQRCEGENALHPSLIEDPFLRRGVREYAPADDMRKVNWTATAKTGELKVNIHESTSLSTIHILLLLEKSAVLRKTEEEEYLIRTAATLNEQLLQRGASVFFAANVFPGEKKESVRVEAPENRPGSRTVDRALAEISLDRDGKGAGEFLEEMFRGLAASDAVIFVMDTLRNRVLKAIDERQALRRPVVLSPYFTSEEPVGETPVPVVYFPAQL